MSARVDLAAANNAVLHSIMEKIKNESASLVFLHEALKFYYKDAGNDIVFRLKLQYWRSQNLSNARAKK